MAALTKSPAHGRRSSSGSGSLRPVLPFELDEGTAIDDNDDEEELGPMPKEPSGPFQSGGGVDEVEYAYGCVSLPVYPAPNMVGLTISQQSMMFSSHGRHDSRRLEHLLPSVMS